MPRPRKPIEQKVLDGTYRPYKDGPLPENLKDWRNGDGPAPGPPEKPSDLSESEAALWDQVIGTRPGAIYPSDSPALRELCWNWAEMKRIKIRLAKMSPENKGYRGLLISHGICTDKFAALCSKFGLTPKDRAAIPVVQVGMAKARVETRGKTRLDQESGAKGKK